MIYIQTWFHGWQDNKSLNKEVAFFRSYSFLLDYFFYENNVVKLIVDNEEAANRRCSSKSVFLKISQSTSAWVSF